MCRSRRLRQVTDLQGNDKSRYFAIAEFNNYFTDHRVCFMLSWCYRCFFFCSIRQLRSLSDNSGNRVVIVEDNFSP